MVQSIYVIKLWPVMHGFASTNPMLGKVGVPISAQISDVSSWDVKFF
jgi:hypothetical protein